MKKTACHQSAHEISGCWLL